MKILVIFCGGTIGSSIMDGKVKLLDNHELPLLEYKKRYDTTGIEFDTEYLYAISSENISFSYVWKLFDMIDSKKDSYDSIIVTHGTDTLQYTAAMLYWMMPDIRIPVFLVSSDRVLSDKNSNGIFNFHGAVVASICRIGGGVYVPYKNSGEDIHIHKATALLPHSLYCDSLFSIQDKIYGLVKYDTLTIFENDYDAQENFKIKPITKKTKHPNIMIVQAYPEVGRMLFSSCSFVDAFILCAYHSGTLPTLDDDFLLFCEETKKRKVKIYVCGRENAYESTQRYENLSLEFLPFVSPVALYTRLYLLYM